MIARIADLMFDVAVFGLTFIVCTGAANCGHPRSCGTAAPSAAVAPASAP